MRFLEFPEANIRVQKAIEKGTLKPLSWGDGKETVCIMSAMVPGAKNINNCVTAGWPYWLTKMCITLFDETGDEDDAETDRQEFAYNLSLACSKTFDADEALYIVLLYLLEDYKHSAINFLERQKYDCEYELQLIKRVVSSIKNFHLRKGSEPPILYEYLHNINNHQLDTSYRKAFLACIVNCVGGVEMYFIENHQGFSDSISNLFNFLLNTAHRDKNEVRNFVEDSRKILVESIIKSQKT